MARDDVKTSPFDPPGDDCCCFSDAINSLEAEDPLLHTLDSTSINDSVPES